MPAYSCRILHWKVNNKDLRLGVPIVICFACKTHDDKIFFWLQKTEISPRIELLLKLYIFKVDMNKNRICTSQRLLSAFKRSRRLLSTLKKATSVRQIFNSTLCVNKFIYFKSCWKCKESNNLMCISKVHVCNNNETKLWDPFRSILDQWRMARSEFCWIEVRVPRDHQNRIRTSQLPPLNAR